MSLIENSGYDTWRSAKALEKIAKHFDQAQPVYQEEEVIDYRLNITHPQEFLLDSQRAYFRQIVKTAVIDYLILNNINSKNAKLHLMKLQAQFNSINLAVKEEILPLSFTQSIFVEAGLIDDNLVNTNQERKHYVTD